MIKQEDFQEKINNKFGLDEWSIVEYGGVKGSLKVKHNKCGEQKTFTQARSFLKSQGKCSCCNTIKINGRPPLTFIELDSRIKKATHNTYELVELVDSTKFIVNHKSCDRPAYATNVSRFFSKGQRCQCTKKGVVGRKPKSH